MNIITGTITEREKAAIYYHVFGGCNDWQQLYIIARDEPLNTPKNKNFVTYVSRWKHTEKIQNYINELRKLQALQEHEQRTRAIDEYKSKEGELSGIENKEHTEKRTKTAVDYNDPQERKRAYNRIISESADDPKTQLDALKVFEQLQRDDKQAAKDNQIQRFYSPLRCSGCPLYQKANKNLTI